MIMGRKNLIVVWGVTRAILEVGSMTVMEGDPSWSGPLAGEALHLKVFHVLEPEIKNHIPPDVYEAELMLLELAIVTKRSGKRLP